MSELAIRAERIMGFTVYGVPQVDYTLDGMAHQDFDTVVADVSLHQASIVEDQTGAIASAINLRKRAANDLGNALAKLAELLCRYDNDTPEQTDLPKPPIKADSPEGEELKALKKRLEEYGYNLEIDVVDPKDCCKSSDTGTEIQITRGVCMKAQTRVQELVDLENNNLQQDMNTLNAFVSKRDKAYTNAEKVVKKYEDTAITLIKSMDI